MTASAVHDSHITQVLQSRQVQRLTTTHTITGPATHHHYWISFFTSLTAPEVCMMKVLQATDAGAGAGFVALVAAKK